MLEFASTSTLSLSVLHSLTLHLGLVESDGLPDLGEAGGHQVDCLVSGIGSYCGGLVRGTDSFCGGQVIGIGQVQKQGRGGDHHVCQG